jgi:hypothetical protein
MLDDLILPRGVMNVFIHKNEEQIGPFSPSQIYEMLDRNEVSERDFAWTEGLSGWQPLSTLLPPAAPPPTSPPSKKGMEIILAPALRYAIGLSLCVVGIIAQEAHRQYSAPVHTSPDTAGLIGGVCVAGLGISGFLIWHRYFKGRHGSIIGLIGLLGAGKEVGGFIARVLISL